MKLPQALLWLLAFVTTIHALALPASLQSISESSKDLFKRKGGGGGRGGGGGGGRGGGSSSTSSSSSGGRGGSGGGTPRTSPQSNTGGSYPGGAGIQPTYGGRGGGRPAVYAGGATTPYRAGAARGGIAPYVLGGAALGVLPGLWLYGAYAYNYPHPYSYRNHTNNQTETHPVQCQCGKYDECGCDANNDTDYINAVANNQTISRLAKINGTDTLVVNGTLPNGTVADGPNSAAGSLQQSLTQMSGYWMVGAGVVYTMWFM